MIYSASILQLCNRHLLEFFHAVEKGDLQQILTIEHELTPEEECVACTYGLRAPKKVKKALNDFFKKQGISYSGLKNQAGQAGIRFVIFRLLLFTLLLLIIWQWGLVIKKLFFGLFLVNSMGFFGWVGVFILATAVFSLIEFLVFD